MGVGDLIVKLNYKSFSNEFKLRAEYLPSKANLAKIES